MLTSRLLLVMALLVLALLASANAALAQNFAAPSASDADVRQWAARSLSSVEPAAAWPMAWAASEAGSLDEFMGRATDYTRVFPSPDRRVAAVVTWSRPADPARGLEVTARLSLRDANGGELASFAVEPLTAFDVSDDGRFVVAHGEQMSRLIQCGALRTHVVFYSREGRELGRVDRGDLSPGYSTAVLSGPARLALGVTGRILGYDLATGEEVWDLRLPNLDDRPQLATAPTHDAFAAVVSSLSGGVRILMVDASGAERGSRSLDGRVNPGSGFGFEQDLLVVQEIRDDSATYHLFDSRTLRTLRSVRAQ